MVMLCLLTLIQFRRESQLLPGSHRCDTCEGKGNEMIIIDFKLPLRIRNVWEFRHSQRLKDLPPFSPLSLFRADHREISVLKVVRDSVCF